MTGGIIRATGCNSDYLIGVLCRHGKIICCYLRKKKPLMCQKIILPFVVLVEGLSPSSVPETLTNVTVAEGWFESENKI